MFRSFSLKRRSMLALLIALAVMVVASPAFPAAGSQPVEQLIVDDNDLRALLGVGAQVQSELTTLDVVVEVTESVNSYEEVWLAGLVSKVPVLDAVVLRWRKSGGWFRFWDLQLAAPKGLLPQAYVDGEEGGYEFIDFGVTTTSLGSYHVQLSADKGSNRLSMQVSSTEGNETLASVTVDGVELHGALRPVVGVVGDKTTETAQSALNLASLQTRSGYEEYGPAISVARDLSLRLISGGAEVQRFEFFDVEEMSAVVDWPDTPVPGQVRLSLVQGDQTIPIFSSKWSADPVTVDFPSLQTLPGGESLLRLEYHSGNKVHVLDERPLHILRNKLHVSYAIYGRNGCIDPDRVEVPLVGDPGLWGSVTIEGERPLDGLRVQLVARYTPSTSQAVAGSLAPEESVLIPVFEEELSADANETLTFPFSFELPERAGSVELELRSAEGQGEVYVYPRNNTTRVVATPMVPAFPGAEGYGKYATGGRGGDVYEVTNLKSWGPGSLGDALSRPGRTIVFRVSGTIKGRFSVPDNTTIAGQTAPGDGITIHGALGLGNNNIIRFIRVRFDGQSNSDAIGARYKSNIILDHVSASWGRDEVMSLYHCKNVTIQWSLVAEACPNIGTESHRFGGIWGNDYSTYHHNLIAHNESRNPRWASGAGHNDYRNNVIYNWGYNSSYGGERVGNSLFTGTWINMIANYYKPGPGTQPSVRDRIVEPSSRGSGDEGSWYVADNYVVGSTSVTNDNWKGVDGRNYVRLAAPWDAMPISQQSAQGAYEAVLAHVGATIPARDAVDARIIEDVRNGTATNGKSGFVTCPADTTLPQLRSAPAPVDSDHDGMPDDWEKANGLNSEDAADGAADADGDGYTNLEEYLNELAASAFPDGYLEKWYARHVE